MIVTVNYIKLLENEVTQNYRRASPHSCNINNEAKELANNLDIAYIVEILAKRNAFITIKHYKQKFGLNPN